MKLQGMSQEPREGSTEMSAISKDSERDQQLLS